MKNLNQIRAKNAYEFATCGKPIVNTEGGDVVKKMPALIMQHGLLAAAAFAYQKQKEDEKKEKEKEKENGFYLCFNAIAKHLATPEIGILKTDKSEPQLEDLLDYLLKNDSYTLRRATDETMQWLCYARRFVVKQKDSKNSNDEE